MKKIYHLIILLTLFSSTSSAQSDAKLEDSPVTPQANTITPESEDEGIIEPKIYDQRNLLTEAQITEIKAKQRQFYNQYQCILSYGIYDGQITNISVKQKWRQMVAKDKNKEFHLFLNIGSFISNNVIELDYRYPPSLKDPQEIDKVLANLKRDLQSEIGLEAVLQRSYESVADELGYLSNKPLFESNFQKKVNAFEAEELKKFLLKVIKLAAIIIAPIILFLIILNMMRKLNNKRPYHFPNVDYTPRLGARYSATSISKIKK